MKGMIMTWSDIRPTYDPDYHVPYRVLRYYDGERAWFHVVRDKGFQRNVIFDCFPTRDEAEHERNRLNEGNYHASRV